MQNKILEEIKTILEKVDQLSLDEKVETLNAIKMEMKKVSPFKDQPIDCVLWVKNDLVAGNDYNPNSVAPPEMQLLEVSIDNDGYTQPIVGWKKEENSYEIVDGFHRHRVGKEAPDIREKIHNYLPLTIINQDREGKEDRIASTIRHNRARGKHSVDAMTEIVVELKKRNWTKEKISKHLGMDTDEILRLTQISGLTEMFKDEEFSESWDIEIQNLNLDEEEIQEELNV